MFGPMLGLIAHAAPISYKFPLPIWLYVAAGGAAVLLSAPAAALAVSEGPARERRGLDLYPLARSLRIGLAARVVVSLLLLVGLIGGLFSTSAQAAEFFENPITVLTWVDFWVGVGIVSWLLGDVWEHISPLNAGARTLDRALARRGVQPLAYPARLGQWPAVALLLVWSWMELIWPNAKDPRTLALLLLAYAIATLGGCALYGAETWLGNVEIFSVFARTLSRFSPLELRPFLPEEWASAPSEDRSARLRLYGSRFAPRSAASDRRRGVRPRNARDRRLRRVVADGSLRFLPAVVLGAVVVPRAARCGVADALDGCRGRRLRRGVPPDRTPPRRGSRLDVDPDRGGLLHGALLRLSADRRAGDAGRDHRPLRPLLEPTWLGRVRALARHHTGGAPSGGSRCC